MLLGSISIIFLLSISVWTFSRNTGSRFIMGGALIAVFIPFEIFNISFAGSYISKVSPFSFYCITVFILFIVKKKLLNKKLKTDSSAVAGILFASYVAVITYLNLGERGFGTFIDNYLSPLFAFLILINEKGKINQQSAKTILIIVSTAAVYGVIEALLKYNIFYGLIFQKMSWIETQWNSSFHRSTSTIGHPLIAASIYIMTLAFIDKNIKNYWIYFFAIGLGILSTGSRAAVLIMLLITLTKHVGIKQSERNIFAFLSIGVVLIGWYLIGAFDQLISRFAYGDGSTIVRTALIEYLPKIIRISFWGHGVGSSGDVANNIGFHNVIEVAWVALLIELGALGLIALFFVAFIAIKKHNLWHGKILFIVSLFLMITSYNSISVHTPLLFLAVLFLFTPNNRCLEKIYEKLHSNNIYTKEIQVPARSIIGGSGVIKGY